MIEYAKGNILDAKVEALVNTVNTVGVMGKGIALQFRQAFPDNYAAYRIACKHHDVKPGHVLVFDTGRFENPRYILNFPTKRHWKGKSRIEDIETGLQDLVKLLIERRIRSVAVPPLGCGNGGLDWSDVRPRIERALGAVGDVRVVVFSPEGAPSPDQMVVHTEPPKMTDGRAAILGAMLAYAEPGYRLALLEIQKLAYLLQEAGEPLRLNFVKGKYGPYAEALNHVLQRIEGHFVRGYGDRSGDASVRILPRGQQLALEFLEHKPDTKMRISRVVDLIEGFETPRGLELLATVDWLAKQDSNVRFNAQAAVHAVHDWSDHKKKAFPPRQIEIAWRQLQERGWLGR
jgi:O-acetyl-ADP-ribose deacetylase (regulator of RNase III)